MKKFGWIAAVILTVFMHSQFAGATELDLETLRNLTITRVKKQEYDFSLAERYLLEVIDERESAKEFTIFALTAVSMLKHESYPKLINHSVSFLLDKGKVEIVAKSINILDKRIRGGLEEGQTWSDGSTLSQLRWALVIQLKKAVTEFRSKVGESLSNGYKNAELSKRVRNILRGINLAADSLEVDRAGYVRGLSLNRDHQLRPQDVIRDEVREILYRFRGQFDSSWNETVEELTRAYKRFVARPCDIILQ